MSSRYFVESPITSDHAVLAGSEAHHLAHVMRAQSGETVVLFDGSGGEFTARIERVGRNTIELTVLSRSDVDRELTIELTLGVALPKGERQNWLVEKATELGVRRLVPLVTERSVAQPVEKTLERLRRAVIEASKQCRRNRLMTIAAPQRWPEFVPAAPVASCRLLAHAGDAITYPGKVPASAAYVLAIGPEGGFTDAEAALALEAGWQRVSLGARTLRVETAAVYLAALATLAAPERRP